MDGRASGAIDRVDVRSFSSLYYLFFFRNHVSETDRQEGDILEVQRGAEVPALDPAVQPGHDRSEAKQQKQRQPERCVHLALLSRTTPENRKRPH